MPDLEERKSIIKEKVLKFLSNKHNLIFLGIFVLALIIRIWVYKITLGQPIWWDEGDYLSLARRWGLNLQIHDIWYYRRTFFLPMLWSFLFKLGGTEAALRFSELIFSITAVVFTYLLGKEMFNRNVGLIAAFGLAVCRIHLFLSGRLLTSLPAATFILIGLWFFWKGYVKEQSNKFIWLAGLFMGLGIFTRLSTFLSLVPLGIFILLKEKGRFWRNKNILIAIFIIILILTPFLILYKQHYPGGIKDFVTHYTSTEKTPTYLGVEGIWIYFKNILDNSSWFLFAFFLAGLGLLIFDLVLGLDMIFKNKRLKRNLFILFWIFTPIVFHGMYSEYLQERLLLWAYPLIFIVAGNGLMKAYEFLKKYQKYVALVFVILILIFAGYAQVRLGKQVILAKKDSYLQVKQAGLWIKENSKADDVVISNSLPQNIYYSDRSTYIPSNEEKLNKMVKESKPKYLVTSIWEKSPDWYYQYPEKYGLTPAKMYTVIDQTGQQQLSLVIYEFNY